MPKKVVFCAHVSLCPKKWYFVPTSLYAQKSGILCPRLFVPTSLYAQKSGILCPRLFVPTSLYAQKSGILCPRLFVPTSLYAQKSGILCPRLFVPTSLCAHVSICPNVCKWEFRVGILYVNSQTYQWSSNGQTDQWSVVKLTSGQTDPW